MHPNLIKYESYYILYISLYCGRIHLSHSNIVVLLAIFSENSVKMSQFSSCKLGCVLRMVVDPILPHAKSGPNYHRKDAPPGPK